MKVSVIIPTKNRFNILEETISCLAGTQSYSKDEAEIIVVNDGDPLPDSFLVKFPKVKIVKNQGNGAGNARNTGASCAKADLFLFIDDDMLTGEDCIEKHIASHTKYDRSLISGTWEYSSFMKSESSRTAFGRFKIANDYAPVSGVEDSGSSGIFNATSLATFNLSITRNDFNELGGFHIDFPFAGCEDQEFTMRAAQKGFRLMVDKSIVCLHNEKDRLSLDGWLMRQFTGVQGFVILCDLFPFRKNDRLYVENTPIRSEDAFSLKVKKTAKYFLSRSWALGSIKLFARSMEGLRVSDNILFRFYNILCGLYLYKGFRIAYRKLHS